MKNKLPKIKISDILYLVLLSFLTYRVIFFTSKLYFYFEAAPWYALDSYFYSFNLIFHELFHLLFMIFGEFMHFLGGTLGEFIFPVIFLLYFFRELNYKGINFCLWWIGFNIVTTGVYMQDAIAQQIPMLFEGADHDWAYLFTRLNILEHAVTIGTFVLVLGQFIVVGSCVLFVLYPLADWMKTQLFDIIKK